MVDSSLDNPLVQSESYSSTIPLSVHLSAYSSSSLSALCVPRFTASSVHGVWAVHQIAVTLLARRRRQEWTVCGVCGAQYVTFVPTISQIGAAQFLAFHTCLEIVSSCDILRIEMPPSFTARVKTRFNRMAGVGSSVRNTSGASCCRDVVPRQ